jgi:hypothetical protein
MGRWFGDTHIGGEGSFALVAMPRLSHRCMSISFCPIHFATGDATPFPHCL